MDAEAMRRKYAEQLMQLPNVTAVGIGEKAGNKVIKVFVTHKVPESALQPAEVIPKELEGTTVDVEESGIVTALNQ